MPQFDVYPNPDSSTKARIPYVITLQADLLGPIENQVVAPLRLVDGDNVIPVLGLNPLAMISGQRYHIRVQDIAAVPRRLLQVPVANLTPQREEILAALDLLFTGL